MIETFFTNILFAVTGNQAYDSIKNLFKSKEIENPKELFIKAFESSFELYRNQTRHQIKTDLAQKIREQITQHYSYPKLLFEAVNNIDIDIFKGLQNEEQQRQQIATQVVATFQINYQHDFHSNAEILAECLEYFDIAWAKHINPTVGVKLILEKLNRTFPKKLPLITESKIPQKLTHIPPINLVEVIGRDKDIENLEKLMFTSNSTQKIVLTSGMGGIGKTTLAQAFVAKNLNNYLHVAWLTQDIDNPVNTFLNNTALLNALQLNFEGSKLDTDQQLSLVFAKMRQLAQAGKNNLLVIDNVNEEFRSLHQIPTPPDWQILVTSREAIAGYENFRLGYLSKETAYELFLLHYHHKLNEENIHIIQCIIAALDYHTLSIELYSKTAQYLKIPLPLLEQKLKNSLQLGYKTDIQSRHNRGRSIEQVFPYLMEIFQLGELSSKEEQMLRLWSILPPTFISVDFVLLLLQIDIEKEDSKWFAYKNAVKKLAKKGWLNMEIQEDGNIKYGMHRIIEEVVNKKWAINEYEQEFADILYSVGGILQEGNYSSQLLNYTISFGEKSLRYLKPQKYRVHPKLSHWIKKANFGFKNA